VENPCAVPTARPDRPWWVAISVRRSEVVSDPSARDLVFLGDSHLEGFYSTASSVRKELLGSRKELNLTFKGDLVQNVNWRARFGALHAFTARAVLLCAGGANREDTPEHAAEGIKAAVEGIRTKQKTAKIILTPVLPRGEAGSEERKWGEAVNALLSDIKANGLYIVDPTPGLLNEDGSLKEGVTKDGGETLTKEGYEVWAGYLKTWIDRYL